MSQLNRLSREDLRRLLAGRIVDVRPRMSASVESLDLVFDDGTSVEIYASKGTPGPMGLGVTTRRKFQEDERRRTS